MNSSRFSALAAAAALSLSTLASCGGAPQTPRVAPGYLPYYSTQGPLTPVDIRTRDAFDLAHPPHAVLMIGNKVPDELADTPKEQPLVVYGEGADGKFEERAAAALTAAGFKNVAVMKGGMAAYTAQKLSTQSTADERGIRDAVDDFRKRQGGADPMRDYQRLKDRIKIERPGL